jgi:hypothetical protein
MTTFDPMMELLSTALVAVMSELEADATNPEPWARARMALDALAATREHEPELAAAIDVADLPALRTLVAQWASGETHLPEQDRAVLKRAMKAYRKSFKVTRLDAESTLGGGPMSSGRHSAIVAITPPPRYPRAVWDELVRQGRLLAAGHGMYELPPE